MPLGTLDRTPPPFFRQGPSALTKLALFGALALFLMVTDARFQLTQPLRAALTTLLYPMQWLTLQPLRLARFAGNYLDSLDAVRANLERTEQRLVTQAQRSAQVEQLALENARLRQLLELRQNLPSEAQPAEVLYDAADPYTRKIVIDRGQALGIAPGSPVLDELGVVGQVTRVYPWLSEVTLLSDRDQTIPVLNTRTGARNLAFGDGGSPTGGLELRFVAATADVLEGDLLTTSGVDGVYPAGLPVARVARVERRADSAFARVYCKPVARIEGTRHVLVLKPLTAQLPPRPATETAPATVKKGARP